jgi:glycine/D-amino acid oxidase-like deaminating enzyme
MQPAEFFTKPYPQSIRSSVAVVGGGVMGLWTALAIATQGRGRVKVRLFEARQVGYTGAASADATRVFRHLHGPDEQTVRWALEAGRGWDYLSRVANRPLLHRTGVLFLRHHERPGDPPSLHSQPFGTTREWMDASADALNALGVPYQRFDKKILAQSYPQFQGVDVEDAVLDTNAGFLEASGSLKALLSLCKSAGVEYHEDARVKAVRDNSQGCQIELENGGNYSSEAVVVTANGWTADLLPLPPNVLTITEQPLIYLTPPSNPSPFSEGRFSVFISLNTDCYGFPIHQGVIKIADDRPFRTLSHPDRRRAVSDEYVQSVLQRVAGFMPGLKDASVARTHVCFYDRSRDGQFILDAWDAEGHIIYGCGFSGRGFKFAPVVGERLARFAVTGERPEDLAPYRLARFAG